MMKYLQGNNWLIVISLILTLFLTHLWPVLIVHKRHQTSMKCKRSSFNFSFQLFYDVIFHFLQCFLSTLTLPAAKWPSRYDLNKSNDIKYLFSKAIEPLCWLMRWDVFIFPTQHWHHPVSWFSVHWGNITLLQDITLPLNFFLAYTE